MIVQAQLGESSQIPPASYLQESEVWGNVGLLGNQAIQLPSNGQIYGIYWAAYSSSLRSPLPAFKLASLKHRIFDAEGRQGRIAASLAAINSPQPTSLTLAQWKEIVEEVEDED